ncbi:MAG: hypothetical protein ACR2LM_02705 [Pyrinomonadaceae bacterium]
MKPVFDIVSEPKAQTYIDLLNFAALRCESFSLVWRDQLRHENSALEIKHVLKLFILSNVRTDEWPGTKLIGHEAIVRRYRVADESVKLLQPAGSLYSWLEPHLLEDLVFYSSGDAAWLVSISHEHQAWFLDGSLMKAEIYAYVPNIQIKEHRGW